MSDKLHYVERLYVYVGYIAITFAGLYLAVIAHQVARFDAWVAAYLILVVGVAQIAIGQGIGRYGRANSVPAALAIFVVYNLANILVVCGRGLEFGSLVFVGTIGIVFAMIYAIVLVGKPKLSWRLLVFYGASIGILLGSIAGSILTIVL